MGSFSLLCIFVLILIIGNSHITKAQDSPANYLNIHNMARAELGINMTNLVWDNKIAAFAQNYANKCKDCKVIPSHKEAYGYGENIAVIAGNLSGVDAVKLWVAERPLYNWYVEMCEGGAECHHYTQVVWGSSRRVGCGKVKCDDGRLFVSCNYYPAGNIPGEVPF
ncbi:pathogenesis-related leaf protein 6-like [Vicia villosa]|uniref:pathogenesis-related leaf protein 6-like n=1 Tax=Vicia villosa TaxID=3911 RepID=UPI00273C8770|nr:pathogenesis-related leaf protein 6-like [Vicia villosa]